MFGQADGVRLGELLLDRCPAQDRIRVLVLISVGGLRMMQADMEGVREIQEHARTLSRRLGERALEGWACLFQGLAPTLAARWIPGRDALTEARDLLREAGVPNGEGKAIAALGLIELITGEPERAKQLVQQALSIQVDAGDLWSQGQCHTYLGMIAEANADLSGATAHYRQAIESLRPFHDAALLPGRSRSRAASSRVGIRGAPQGRGGASGDASARRGEFPRSSGSAWRGAGG